MDEFSKKNEEFFIKPRPRQFTLDEYEYIFKNYLNALSMEISEDSAFTSSVSKIGTFSHESDIPGNCSNLTYELLISKQTNIRDQAFEFALIFDCPIHHYQVFGISLTEPVSLDPQPMMSFLKTVGRYVPNFSEYGFRYHESVYINGLQRRDFELSRPLKAEIIVADINAWIDTAEKIIAAAKILDLNPFKLIDHLPKQNIDGFLNFVASEVANSNKDIVQIKNHWKSSL